LIVIRASRHKKIHIVISMVFIFILLSMIIGIAAATSTSKIRNSIMSIRKFIENIAFFSVMLKNPHSKGVFMFFDILVFSVKIKTRDIIISRTIMNIKDRFVNIFDLEVF